MRRTIFTVLTILVIFVTVLAVLVVHPVQNVKANHGCSNATLKGNYGLVAKGAVGNAAPLGSASISALVHFDGEGSLGESSWNMVINGKLATLPASTGYSYTVNSDCTCTFETDVYTFNGTVVDTGGELFGSVYNPSPGPVSLPTYIAYFTATFDAKKVSDLEDR